MTSAQLFCYDATLIDISDKVQRMEHTFQFFSDDETIESELEDFLEPGEERALKVRLDKWLWAARFFKTRAVARAAVEKGKVFYNGERAKPSREIEIGATLQILGRKEITVIVKGLSTRRRSTEEALKLFEETEESRSGGSGSTQGQIGEWSPAPYYPSAIRTNQHTFYQQQYFNQQQSEPPKERRAVRFLRRSFVRGDQQPRQEHRTSPYSNAPRQPEFEPFE